MIPLCFEFVDEALQIGICVVVFPAFFGLALSQTIAQIQALVQICILLLLQRHLVLNDEVHELDCLVNALDLSVVAVFEVQRIQSQPRTPSHGVDDELNEPLLLHWVADMLIAFHVELRQKHLLELESCLTGEQVIDHLLSILLVDDPVNLTIIKLFKPRNVEGADSEKLLLQNLHVGESTLVHDVDTEIVFDEDLLLSLIDFDMINPVHHLHALLRDELWPLLLVNEFTSYSAWLTKSAMEPWHDWAR